MPSPNDPARKDIEDLYKYIKEWHTLVNEKLDEIIKCNYPITLKGTSEEEVIEITDPENLKHVRIGLILARKLIKPFPFYLHEEEESNEIY